MKAVACGILDGYEIKYMYFYLSYKVWIFYYESVYR